MQDYQILSFHARAAAIFHLILSITLLWKVSIHIFTSKSIHQDEVVDSFFELSNFSLVFLLIQYMDEFFLFELDSESELMLFNLVSQVPKFVISDASLNWSEEEFWLYNLFYAHLSLRVDREKN